MSFTRSFFRLFPRFLFIHIITNLVLGYWDMRISDQYLYQNQMARVHYIRTLEAHLVLGTIMAIFLTAIFAAYYSRKEHEPSIEYISKTQIPFSVALVTFLIIGIKIHLVWLDGHLLDPEGLFWTFAAAVFCVLLFLTLRVFTGLLFGNPNTRYILAGIVALIVGFTLQSGYRKVSAPPATAAAKTPNVLLIVIDTLRWDHLSAYGYFRTTTPSIDQLAREAVQYQTAISQSPWTTPSHAALFTGQYPSRNGVDGKNIHLHPDNKTMAEVLGRNGYQTAGFINNVYLRRQTGLAQGFQQYEEFWGRNEGSSLMILVEFLIEKWHPRLDKGASETNRAVANWLSHDWNPDNPFFLFTHYMEPHAIYGSTTIYNQDFLPPGVNNVEARRVNQDPELYICDKLQMTDQDFEILRSLYNSDIRYLDNYIKELLSLLQNRRLSQNTIVVLTADHGESFGEHHLMSHELSLYDTLVRVPLLIRYPDKVYAGSKEDRPVQLIDIFPSLLQLIQISPEGLTLQGSSLLPDEMKNRPGEFVFAEYNNARAVDNIERRFGKDVPKNPVYNPKILKTIRSAGWKLIWGTDGTKELYEIDQDPYEKIDLLHANPEKTSQLELALKEWASSFPPSNYYRQEDISREAERELRSLGYIQ